MTEWATRVEAHLIDLGLFLRDSDWYGRENELVNLFAHSFLTRANEREPIHASQLGIEVAVRQLTRSRGKAVVRKDLVIWDKQNQTVWTRGMAVNEPVVVIEFKINDGKKCASDIAWLKNYTNAFQGVLGYSICGFLKERRGVAFRRIERGHVGECVFSPSAADAGAAASSEGTDTARQSLPGER